MERGEGGTAAAPDVAHAHHTTATWRRLGREDGQGKGEAERASILCSAMARAAMQAKWMRMRVVVVGCVAQSSLRASARVHAGLLGCMHRVSIRQLLLQLQ